MESGRRPLDQVTRLPLQEAHRRFGRPGVVFVDVRRREELGSGTRLLYYAAPKSSPLT